MGGSSSNPEIKIDNKRENFKILNNNLKCPIIGLGTALIEGEKDIDVVYQSIKDGVRLIDTCPANEEFVGKGIKKAINEGIVKREELFIVTKLELDEKEDPEKALRKSLERLQLKYVDLYLDHWPSCVCINDSKKYSLIPVRETWKKMEALVKADLTKSIGVSNYNVENLFNILSVCKIKPVVNEVEFHPYLYQKDLKEFCDKENIVLFAYNPLVKGEYVDREDVFDRNLNLFKEATVKFMKKKYPNYSIGQIILSWHITIGVVPIPGTSKPERMKENLQSIKMSGNQDFIELISSYEDKIFRFNDGSDIFGINIFA